MTMHQTINPAVATGKLDVAKLRQDFPALTMQVYGKPLVYLDNAASTQRPRQVIQAIVDVYERHYANVHRGIHWLSDQSTDLFEEARGKVRAFVGAAGIVSRQATLTALVEEIHGPALPTSA